MKVVHSVVIILYLMVGLLFIAYVHVKAPDKATKSLIERPLA
uniref:Peroxidase n=1 Tax=Rhizophora mucronata TaxID=61149 RepID=A0A2P2LJC2_RHIMU